jgi:hypothetical protein
LFSFRDRNKDYFDLTGFRFGCKGHQSCIQAPTYRFELINGELRGGARY